MLVQSIHYTFAPEDGDKVEAILRELQDASRKEAGVVQFEVARSQEHPNVFALWEVYRDESRVGSAQRDRALQAPCGKRRTAA